MDRFGRSIELVEQSFRVLMQDKTLMILPIVSGIVTAGVVATFVVGTFGMSVADLRQPLQPIVFLPVFVMYVVTYFVGIFFQAAVIAGATQRLRGGDPTIGSAIAAAADRSAQILGWAVIAATVGTLLQLIRGRGRIVERLVAGFLGAAWSLATFFVVPVLVLEDVPVSALFGRSLSLMEDRWGEGIIGTIGLGLVSFVCWLLLAGIVASVVVGLHQIVAAIVIGAVGGVALVAAFSALNGIYVAALYHYATTGSAAPGFDSETLQGAFRTR
jgi:hypothetical protein